MADTPMEYRIENLFYEASATRQQFLMQRLGVPQLVRSGHASHEAVSSGEDNQTCQRSVFPTT